MYTLGSGIKCWICRSLEDPKCADPFDNTSTPFFDCATIADLPHLPGVKATMCRKIRQKVNGEWRYIRSCARLGEPGIGGDERYCLQRAGTFNIHVESCTCNSKDGCNSGYSIKYSSLHLPIFLPFFGYMLHNLIIWTISHCRISLYCRHKNLLFTCNPSTIRPMLQEKIPSAFLNPLFYAFCAKWHVAEYKIVWFFCFLHLVLVIPASKLVYVCLISITCECIHSNYLFVIMIGDVRANICLKVT